ncbi:hypothetical protein PR003_g19182, partial [Phytophthora rubi]
SEDAAAEQYHALQDQFAASQALVTVLTAQLAAAPPSASSASLAQLFAVQGERDDLRVQFAAAQAAFPPVQARLDAVVAERDLAQQAVGLAERQRDDAFAERDRHRRTLVIVEQERDGAVDMRDQAPRASVTLRRQRDAAVAERDQARQASAILEQQHAATVEEPRVARDSLSQSHTEVESAPRLNAPLQDDLRRVNALFVAHAEELRRGTTRIHELEGTVATASTLRVAAESEMARAQASELQATSRSALYRAGWLCMRPASERRREAVDAHVRRLSIRLPELEEERDLAVRERDERAVAWRRKLREARRGREMAQRVRDELAGIVMSVGGQIDTVDLVRRLKATFTAEVNAAIPLPPADPSQTAALATPVGPVPVVPTSGSGESSTTPVGGSASSLVPSPAASSVPASPSSTASLSPTTSGLCRPRRGGSSRSGSQLRSSSPSRAASVSSAHSPPRRRSQRLSTVADTAASDSAAAQTSPATSSSAAAATAAQASEDAALFGSESSDSDIQPRPKRQRLRLYGSRSRSSAHSPPRSRPRSRSRSPSVSSARSVGSAGSARSTSVSLTHSSGSAVPCLSASLSRSGRGSGDSGGSSGDESSSPSSSRSLASNSAPSGSAGNASAAPFFAPPAPETANWNRALLTLANVEALYATRPWRYLAQAVEAPLFAPDNAAFRPFSRRLRRHLESWAQAYWESTHELFVQGAAWSRWRTARNSRRSHADAHLNSVLQLAVVTGLVSTRH